MTALRRAIADRLGFNPITWLHDVKIMRRFARGVDVSPTNRASPRKRFAVFITPWLGTRVPWFSLACGLLLASRGNTVTFVVNDVVFGEHEVRWRFVLRCVRSVLRDLDGHGDVVCLSNYKSTAGGDLSSSPDLERFAQLNAVWALRGETVVAGRQRYTAIVQRQLENTAGAIANFLRQPCDAVLIPGGIYGSTGVWAECARAAGVRVATFDSGGPGILTLAVNGIASQLQDIPRAFGMLKQWSTTARRHAFIVGEAQAEIARRRAGVDTFALQMKGSRAIDSRYDRGVLVALNSSWDSAALGLHAVFDNSAEWLLETVRYLLTETQVPVIVRQHPVERLEKARTSDDYRTLLAQSFAEHPRLHFIPAHEPINSYDLLERVAAVVVNTSTIGIEAAAHGRVVVTASRSYYSALGFVWKADQRELYNAHLLAAAAGEYAVSGSMRDDALYCYYLTQCCNWNFTPFAPESFEQWSSLSFGELAGDHGVQMIVRALEEDVPIAFLNHLARTESARVQ